MPRIRKQNISREKWGHKGVKDAPTSPPVGDKNEYTTVAEAASNVGVTTAAIRMRLQDIPHYKEEKQPLKVHFTIVGNVFGWVSEEESKNGLGTK